MAQLAILDRALSALLAWTVVSEPPCPVLRACRRSAASAASNLSHHDMIRSVTQGMAHEIADRHRAFLQPPGLEPDTIRVVDA